MTLERPPAVPDLDWDPERSRLFGDRALDLWQELLERLPYLPVSGRWTAKEVHEAVAIDVPDEPMPEDALFAYLHDVVFDWSELSGHPRFMAYISGAGTVPGVAADLIAAGLNANVGGWQLSPAASEIELHLTRWFASELFGFPEGSGGLVLSGGAMANFVGLKTARDHRAGWNVRAEGLAGHPPLVMYMSSETHVVSSRGADMLGIGTEGVRTIPVGDDYRIRTDALRAAIEADRTAGRLPFAVVASAGTVSTGAVDPLPEIADICAEQELWMHVDAAYGGPALLADDLRPSFSGIERADSVAFDPHKWLYTPLTGGCLVVRRMAALAESFDADASLHRPGQGVHAARARSGQARAAVLPRLLGVEGVGLVAGAWATRVRPSHLARRRAGAIPGGAGGGATRLRAGRARRTVDLLLPLRPAGPARGRGSRARTSTTSTIAS